MVNPVPTPDLGYIRIMLEGAYKPLKEWSLSDGASATATAIEEARRSIFAVLEHLKEHGA